MLKDLIETVAMHLPCPHGELHGFRVHAKWCKLDHCYTQADLDQCYTQCDLDQCYTSADLDDWIIVVLKLT